MTYLDSNIVIFLVEQRPSLGARALAALQAILAGNDQVAISDLHRFECCYGPLTRKDHARLGLFDLFFRSPGVVFVPLGSGVFERACSISVQNGIRPFDALHLAAAMEAGC